MLTVAPEHHNTNGIVRGAVAESIDKPLDDVAVIGVVYIGTVDRDGGDATRVFGEQDNGVGHGKAFCQHGTLPRAG